MRVRVAAVAVWALTAACGARTPLVLGDAPDASAGDDTVDASIAADAVVPDCVSAGASLIYLVSDTSPIVLYTLDPASGAFAEVGTLDCPTSDVPNAFSIAVDRKGTAYVLTSDFGSPAQGALWQVSTATAHCEAVLDYARGQLGFSVFGMAFATNGSGADETLYLEGAADLGSVAAFGTLDTATWRVTYVGATEPSITRGQLTGTGDGRLFEVYYSGVNRPASLPFGQVVTSTGRPENVDEEATPDLGGPFSAAWANGVAYLFATDAPSQTTRVTTVPVMGAPFSIPGGVGIAAAGISTCAHP